MPLFIRQSAASIRKNMYWPASTPKGGIVCLHGNEGGWAGWNDLYCALFAANRFVGRGSKAGHTESRVGAVRTDDGTLMFSGAVRDGSMCWRSGEAARG